MRKYFYLYYYQGQIMAIATHRLDKFGCACREYRNVTPSSYSRFMGLSKQYYTKVDSWDTGEYHTTEVNASTWDASRAPFSMYKNDITFGTGPSFVSMQRFTVIRTMLVRIDRQGNRSAQITRVVEGIGCDYTEEYDNISFSTFTRFMELTLNHDYYIIPSSSMVTFVVQSEKYQ
jgi:hypothetical protein